MNGLLARSFTDTQPHIPGELGLPWLGVTLDFLRDPLALMDHLYATHGPVFKIRGVGEVVVLVADAELAREILLDKKDIYSSRRGWDFLIGDLFKEGLLLKDGQDHRFHREMLQQAFVKKPMAGYLKIMAPEVGNYFSGDPWRAGKNKTIHVFEAVKALTLRLAGQVFFGVRLEEGGKLAGVNQAISDIVYASGDVLKIPLPFTLYGKGLAGRLALIQYFRSLIPGRRKAPTPDLFGQLCTVKLNGRELSDMEILNHAIFTLMAAHDTTASSITSLIYQLGLHPQWQAKIRSEARDFLAAGEFEYGRLKELDLLGRAFRETLRLHPPLVFYLRKLTADTELAGYPLQAGSRVAVVSHIIQRRADYWRDPEKFDPDRFRPEVGEYKKPAQKFIPFGAGKHLCLGMNFAEMQARLIMTYLITTYKWELPASYRAKFQVPLQEPVDGLPVRFQAAEP